MTDRSHLRFGADPFSLDDLTAERLVRGLAPEDAPPLYRGASEALAALRAAPSAAELAGEAEVVRGMAAVIDTTTNDTTNDQRRPRMLSRFLSAKVVAAGAAGLLSLGGVAAAATGSLPSPLQQTVASLASPVVHLAGADDSTTVGTSTTSTTEATTTTVAPLATAGATGAGAAAGTTPVPGSEEACRAATNHGEFVSGVARDRSTTGRDHGRAVSEAAHSDCGKDHTTTTLGQQSSTAPVASSHDDTEDHEAPDADASEHNGSSASSATSPTSEPTTTTAAPSAPVSHGHGNGHGSGDR